MCNQLPESFLMSFQVMQKKVNIFSKKVENIIQSFFCPSWLLTWKELKWDLFSFCWRWEKKRNIYTSLNWSEIIYIFILCNRMWQISKYDTQWDWFRYLVKELDCLLLNSPSYCCCYRSFQLFVKLIWSKSLIATLTCFDSFGKAWSLV